MNNTFRDVKFGYANEMALICKDLGLDMNSLVSAANNGYVRDKIPVPSPGVGGPCLPKDAKILSYSRHSTDSCLEKKWPPTDITRKYEKLCIVAFNRKFDYDDVIKMKKMSYSS